MNSTQRTLLASAVLAAALGAGYLWSLQAEAPLTAAPAAVQAPAPDIPAVPVGPAVRHVLKPAPAAETLPALDESDQPLAQALAELVGAKAWRTMFHSERIVRRIVATVDNLPRRHAPVKMWPLRPVGSWFEIVRGGETLTASPTNALRYAAYARLVQAVDVARLATVYRNFYPLFQQAYVELGYPQGYFNDRVVIAIDDLLAAPEFDDAPQLVQTKVFYEYAEPSLEQRSAGQKIMLRIGADNARSVKATLRSFRGAIAKP